MRVGKLDAARRQIEVAISLYFSDGDPVAIHTLAHASHCLLHDLSEAGEGKETLHKQMMSLIREEKHAEVRRMFREAGNFFKHADKDPSAVLEFRPAQTEWLLFECCITYSILANAWTKWSRLMLIWMTAHNPEILNEPIKSELMGQLAGMKLESVSRSQFKQVFFASRIGPDPARGGEF